MLRNAVFGQNRLQNYCFFLICASRLRLNMYFFFIFLRKYLRMSEKSSTFAPAFVKTAGWMSDLVSGLQNRLERFDSATGLQKKSLFERVTFLN